MSHTSIAPAPTFDADLDTAPPSAPRIWSMFAATSHRDPLELREFGPEAYATRYRDDVPPVAVLIIEDEDGDLRGWIPRGSETVGVIHPLDHYELNHPGDLRHDVHYGRGETLRLRAVRILP